MSDTVTVASRLPMALRLDVEGHPSAVLNGNNHREALDGAGITHGVDKALLDAWMETHGESDAVTQGLIQVVDDAKVEEARADVPQPVQSKPSLSIAPPAPTERADVADTKLMKESKIVPATLPEAQPT